MYDNAYNRGVAGKISEMTKRMILHQDSMNNETDREHKITSRLEGMAMRKKDVQGGSGYAAATVGDHGYQEDSTVGVGRKKRGPQGEGMSAAGISAGGVQIGSGKDGVVATPMQSGTGVSAAGVSAAGRRKKNGAGVTGGDLSLLHYNELKGQPAFTAPANAKRTVSTVEPSARPVSKLSTHDDMQAAYVAGAAPKARKPSARNELVRKVMKGHSLSLPAASKYVKEHNLYKRAGSS
jgi:hypothetical protein